MGKVEQMRAFREAQYRQRHSRSTSPPSPQRTSPAALKKSAPETPADTTEAAALSDSATGTEDASVTPLLPAAGKTIQQYSDLELQAVVRFVVRERGTTGPDAVIIAVMEQLGFQRRGKVITQRVQQALQVVLPESLAG